MTTSSAIFFHTSLKMYEIHNVYLFQEIFRGHSNIKLSRNVKRKRDSVIFFLGLLSQWSCNSAFLLIIPFTLTPP